GTDPPRVLRRYLPSGKSLGNTGGAAVALDPSGAPWLASTSGVERPDARSDRFVGVPNLPRDAVSALAFGSEGTPWTHPLGALEHWRIDGEQALLMQRYDNTRGWPTVAAHGLAVDARGDVWATSPRGLLRLDTKTQAVRRFDARDGLPSQEFLPSSLAVAADG